MKTCSKCKKPTETFPLSKRGTPSKMCQPCYDWQRIWNGRKHEQTKKFINRVEPGFRFCTTCRKAKPEDEFKTNPKQRRKISRGELFAKHCEGCRTKLADRANKKRHKAHEDVFVKEEFLAGKREYSRQFRIKLLAAYGGRCVCCGETEPKFLELDHINGEGGKHRKQIGAGPEPLYRWAERNGFPPILQILCGSCHTAKSFWGTCPHQEFSVLHLVPKTA